MSYKILIDKPALKFLQKQPQNQRERLLKAINLLPTYGDIKPLLAHQNQYRLRVGSFRVIYAIKNDQLLVQVLNIGNSGDIYK